MPSNRLYDKTICQNPFCGMSFNPHDKRHVYHNEQCRANYNNDKRQFLELLRNGKVIGLEFNDWLLKAIFSNSSYKGTIPERVLLNLDFNFAIGEWNENIDTQRPIRWFLEYGLEMINTKERIFEIHKRNNYDTS